MSVVSTGTGVKEANVILFLLKPDVSVAEAEAFIKEKKTHSHHKSPLSKVQEPISLQML